MTSSTTRTRRQRRVHWTSCALQCKVLFGFGSWVGRAQVDAQAAAALDLLTEWGHDTLYCRVLQGHAMRELQRALADINAIRTQMARETQFRGYGPRSTAASGLLALM